MHAKSSSKKLPYKKMTALPEDSLAATFFKAASVLATVFKGQNLDVALASAVLSAVSRPGVMDMTYSCLRAYGRGEFMLGLLLKTGIKVAEVQSLLLLAVNRLEQRPEEAHTTVDQAVSAAGLMAGGHFKALVNGVLRNYLRQRDALIETLWRDDVAYWQHPAWWITALKNAYPEQWGEILAAGNTHPPMSLRVNLLRGSVSAYAKRLSEASIAIDMQTPHGIKLTKPVGVDALPGFFDGDASVQDLGAQRAAELLDVHAGMRVLDACAAPGGKTAHVLEIASVSLLALDAESRRATRITENLQRLGLQAEVKVADCRKVEKWWDGQRFDRILADVPCSASGVVRRHPDAKYLRRREDVYGFAATQREIIDALWPVLAPGGKMLYCTCSVFPEENGQQIAAFLERHPDAERMMIAGQDELQLLPNANHDGFYFALLRKRAS